MSEKKEEKAAAPAAKKSPMKLILIIVGALAIGGGGVGGWMAFSHKAKTKGGKAAEAAPAPKEKGPAIYVALDPPFVTNFEAEQAVRFLQITAQVMTHDAPTAELLKNNDPVIRNNLLMLFGNQKYADLTALTGKEKLRTDALATVRKAVGDAGGKPENIEALYFTSFVMQ